MTAINDPFAARTTLECAGGPVTYYRLAALSHLGDITRLPMTVKILLENLLRNCGSNGFEAAQVEALARWRPEAAIASELPYLPSRVLLQDLTGVPAVVDLAAMRSAIQRLGGDASKINPLLPADLVIDHSVQVDSFASRSAYSINVDREYQRNHERYALLRWAQQAFDGLRIVPPGTGICHQVNLEYLSTVVGFREIDGDRIAFPDTCVGTDSHTPMVNGLGVLAWGVGGIEAEGAMLGQPIYMLSPKVVGVRFVGDMPEGTTATDLVLTVTQMLRAHGVVGSFVEYFGAGLSKLSVPNRATIGNMSPEYGATAGLFPVDNETLEYLRLTGRSEEQIDLVERYCKAQGLFRTDALPEPMYDEVLQLDLSTIVASVAGPRRPQDRVALSGVRAAFYAAFGEHIGELDGGEDEDEAATDHVIEDSFPASDPLPAQNQHPGGRESHSAISGSHISLREPAFGPRMVDIGNGMQLGHGSVVIAAITSCTNTSNPSVMLTAGLLAKKAVALGLSVNPTVKTSLAPGSRAVTDYYESAGLTDSLEALGFYTVGYGCTTCIGNSGPLVPEVEKAVVENNLMVAAVLSGNRNFEGRIHAQVHASFLASPPLVVAYALAGTIHIDLSADPLGYGHGGMPVYLRDIWPSPSEIRDVIDSAVKAEVFAENYARVFEGDEKWISMATPKGQLYSWDTESTYIQEPPFFDGLQLEPKPPGDIVGARVLLKLGDSITTDHVSPAGSIPVASPAGEYLIANNVGRSDFNSYGARRGNHEVMVRGTFANIRLRNELIPSREGWWTRHLPTGEEVSIFEASCRYRQSGTPTIILAGREYGTGSSRDWAAKGPALLGIKATIAESYERIHRSNLVMMGVLPLQFTAGQGRDSLGLDGSESFDIHGIGGGLVPGQTLEVTARHPGGAQELRFPVVLRVDTAAEAEYIRHGGILPMVLRRLASE